MKKTHTFGFPRTRFTTNGVLNTNGFEICDVFYPFFQDTYTGKVYIEIPEDELILIAIKDTATYTQIIKFEIAYKPTLDSQ